MKKHKEKSEDSSHGLNIVLGAETMTDSHNILGLLKEVYMDRMCEVYLIMPAGLLEEPRISVCSRGRDDSGVSNNVSFLV